MYKDYWSLARYPFENSPDPDFLFLSPRHREALQWVQYGVRERKGAVVLTGGVGCGKTVLSRRLVRELPSEAYNLAVIVNPSLPPVDLLREILYQLDIHPAPKNKVEILHALNASLIAAHRAGRHTVIVVDEAQAIRHSGTLEELRLLLNFQLNDAYLLTLVLIGQPEWSERLAHLPQLEQRIAVNYHLEALETAETEQYIGHRVRTAGAKTNMFTLPAMRGIHLATAGVPRRINTLCDRALLAAAQAGSLQVEENLVMRLVPQ